MKNEGKTFSDLARAIRSAEADGVVQVLYEFISMKDGTVQACALGAAAIGFGTPREQWKYVSNSFLLNHWPVFSRQVIMPGRGSSCSLTWAIETLNDERRWPLSQIAAWLEGLPEAESTKKKELVYVL